MRPSRGSSPQASRCAIARGEHLAESGGGVSSKRIISSWGGRVPWRKTPRPSSRSHWPAGLLLTPGAAAGPLPQGFPQQVLRRPTLGRFAGRGCTSSSASQGRRLWIGLRLATKLRVPHYRPGAHDTALAQAIVDAVRPLERKRFMLSAVDAREVYPQVGLAAFPDT